MDQFDPGEGQLDHYAQFAPEYTAAEVKEIDVEILAPLTLTELQETAQLELVTEALRQVIRASFMLTRTTYVNQLSYDRAYNVDVAKTTRPRNINAESAKHLASCENQVPCWQDPVELQEVQVWHDHQLYRFHGPEAFRRLTILSPAAFMPQGNAIRAGHKKAAIAEYSVTDKLVLRVTALTLARCAIGSKKFKPSTQEMINLILHDENFEMDPRDRGYRTNRRFYESICHVHGVFHILSKAEPTLARALKNLGNFLVSSMLDGGASRSESVVAFLDAVEVIIRGEPKSKLERHILDEFPPHIQALLYRTRRVFYKDDNDPLQNCRDAISRMTEPVVPSDDDSIAMACLAHFRTELRAWLDTKREVIPEWIDKTSLHRSAASVLYPRSQGGGSREMHLMVGLHRLSQGKASSLQDVFGQLESNLDFEELLEHLSPNSDRKTEIYEAAAWWMKEVVVDRDLVRPFLCIYPEREPKSRTFMLLDWATQQGCALYTTVLYRFLKQVAFCREAFAGFNTESLRRQLGRATGDHVLSLDSAVSTDPLRHDFALEVYREIDEFVPEFAKLALHKTFSPIRVGASVKRPKLVLDDIVLSRNIGHRTGLKIRAEDREQVAFRHPRRRPKRFLDDVPPQIVVYKDRYEIAEAIELHGRVMLKSPTGTGKTVFAASAYRSIIQFPSIANLVLFSASCRHFGISHNLCYSLEKGQIDQESGEVKASFKLDEDGTPYTILTTSFYVMQLAQRYPQMLVVLDEAEARMEDFVLNILETREQGCCTLLMSATPEAIRDHGAHILELTNPNIYPILDATCTLGEMVDMVKNPDFGKTLICTFSEPNCYTLASKLGGARNGVFCLTARERQGQFAQKVEEARVIISTNVVRSSVTIDGLLHVFDLGLVYESVDMPRQGFEALHLFEIPESGRTQLRGRVGRVGPGTSWTVTNVGRKGLPTLPILGARPTRAARRIESLDCDLTPLPLNVASCIVEAFNLKVIERGVGQVPNRGRPYCLPILEHFVGNLPQMRDLARVLLFEESQLPQLLFQLREEEEFSELYRSFVRPTGNLVVATRDLVDELLKQPLFQTPAGRILKWTEKYPLGDFDAGFDSTNAMKAISLSMWRNVAQASGSMITGMFRDFTLPNSFPRNLRESGYVVVFGLAWGRNTVKARGLYALTDEVFEWLKLNIEQVTDIGLSSPNVDETNLPVYSTHSITIREPDERRHTALSVNQPGSSGLFMPEDLDEILERITACTDGVIVGECSVTTRGSPMSSVASFGVLNGFSHAATLPKDPTVAEFGFGDDYIGVGEKSKLLRYIRQREALGLRTKWSATGLVERTGQTLALYTERFFNPTDFGEIKSVKPKGLYNLYSAWHSQGLIVSKVAQAADYEAYSRVIRDEFPDYYDAIMSNRDEVVLQYPRRSTMARSLLTSALRTDVNPNQRILEEKSADQLLLHLESAILQMHPSYRGEPRRVVEPNRPVFGGPFVSVEHARRLTEELNEDEGARRAFLPGFSMDNVVLQNRTITQILHQAMADRRVPKPENSWDAQSCADALGEPIRFRKRR